MSRFEVRTMVDSKPKKLEASFKDFNDARFYATNLNTSFGEKFCIVDTFLDDVEGNDNRIVWMVC